MKYIDKSAVIAEIERRRKLVSDPILSGNDLMIGERNAYFNLLSFIDTLEVKEVDLEKSISDWLSEGLPNDEELIDYIKETAEHFFELGISVSNSIKVTTPDVDDVLKENGVNPDSKEAKIIKESYFMAIEKLAQKGEL